MAKYMLVYDGSFEGYLTAVFEVYAQKIDPAGFKAAGDKYRLFDPHIVIKTDLAKAERLMKGIMEKSSVKHLRFIHQCFLAETRNVELDLLFFIRQIFKGQLELLKNFGNPVILDLHQLYKKVGRETHRMHAFVRFQELRDGLFAALIEPDFNVLPLIGFHFRDRFPAMRWFIFDLRRNYGLYHENRILNFRTLENSPVKMDRRFSEEMLTETELEFQDWWRAYFKSVNIPERRNDKLHRQHVPRRYWPFLIEKSTK